MKAIRFAVPVFALALCASTAFSLDQDMEALMARLAAQEARMADQDARINDLNAKIATERGPREIGEVEGILSVQKNAVVTIGGLVTTRYQYTHAKIDSDFAFDGTPKPYSRTASVKQGNLFINDAELSVQIDVNDHFDAFLNVDLHNGGGDDYGNAMSYYVRWKNICDTGFGIKVGRDALVFGEEGVGELKSYTAGTGEALGDIDFGFDPPESLILPHNGWDMDGVVQVTPYWEGWDGKLNLELSFMQNTWNTGPSMDPQNYFRTKNGVVKIRSRNYGLGSMSFRAVVEPIDGLRFSGSIVNFHSNGHDELPDNMHNKNNTAISLAFSYRPAFHDKLNIWGQWVKGWNVDNMDGYDSDAVNFGASYDLTDALTIFAQGDYLRGKVDFADTYGYGPYRYRGKAWAWYGGIMYDFGYGVMLEAGWKHERYDWSESGNVNTKLKATADTIYANLGFEF